MSEEIKGRFMKNVKTDVLYVFDEKQVEKKLHMVECDDEGNLLIENISVASGEMISVMEDLVKDKADLKERNLYLEKTILKYKAKYGSLKSALPEPKKKAPAKKAEKLAKAEVEVPPEPKVIAPEDLETPEKIPSKKEMAATLKEVYGIEVDPKKNSVDALCTMIAEAAVVPPEEAEALNDMLK